MLGSFTDGPENRHRPPGLMLSFLLGVYMIYAHLYFHIFLGGGSVALRSGLLLEHAENTVAWLVRQFFNRVFEGFHVFFARTKQCPSIGQIGLFNQSDGLKSDVSWLAFLNIFLVFVWQKKQNDPKLLELRLLVSEFIRDGELFQQAEEFFQLYLLCMFVVFSMFLHVFARSFFAGDGRFVGPQGVSSD